MQIESHALVRSDFVETQTCCRLLSYMSHILYSSCFFSVVVNRLKSNRLQTIFPVSIHSFRSHITIFFVHISEFYGNRLRYFSFYLNQKLSHFEQPMIHCIRCRHHRHLFNENRVKNFLHVKYTLSSFYFSGKQTSAIFIFQIKKKKRKKYRHKSVLCC